MFIADTPPDPSLHLVSLEIKVSANFLSTDKVVKELPKVLRRVLTEGKNFWTSEAGRRLNTTRREYQLAIFTRPSALELGLSGGFLPYAVEVGTTSFDMKPGLLGNATARTIPLNVNRIPVLRNPEKYARVSLGSPSGSWQHPGFKGTNIRQAVIDEINNNILPKHIAALFGTP